MVGCSARADPRGARRTNGALTMRLWPSKQQSIRVAVILGLVSGLAVLCLLIDLNDLKHAAAKPVEIYPGVRLWVDPIERCEYLIYDSAVGGHIIPRRTAEGDQRCEPPVINNNSTVRVL